MEMQVLEENERHAPWERSHRTHTAGPKVTQEVSPLTPWVNLSFAGLSGKKRGQTDSQTDRNFEKGSKISVVNGGGSQPTFFYLYLSFSAKGGVVEGGFGGGDNLFNKQKQ